MVVGNFSLNDALEGFNGETNNLTWQIDSGELTEGDDLADRSNAIFDFILSDGTKFKVSDLARLASFISYHLYSYPGTNQRTQDLALVCAQKMKDVIADSILQTDDNIPHQFVEQATLQLRQDLHVAGGFRDKTIEWSSHKVDMALLEWCIHNCDSKFSWHNMWGTILPLVLSLIDHSLPAIKAKGCDLATKFVEVTANLTPSMANSTQYLPLLREAVHPCLFYLPPGTSAPTSTRVVKSAIVCLRTIAVVSDPQPLTAQTDSRMFTMTDQKRVLLYDLMYKGIFAPLSQSSSGRSNTKEPQLTLMLLEQASLIIEELKTETVHFLPSIVKLYLELMCDPFTAQSVIKSTCRLMMISMSYVWPRIAQYQFDIYVGLEKVRKQQDQHDSECLTLMAEVQQMLGNIVS